MTALILCNIFVVLMGIPAIWLANFPEGHNWKKWASVFGVLGQPAWYYIAWSTGQWGLFAMTIIYTGAWMLGIYTHWIKK